MSDEHSEEREELVPTLGVLYGVVLDSEGSTDYYDSPLEAFEYANRHGLSVVRVTTEEVHCICYGPPSSRCEIHGY